MAGQHESLFREEVVTARNMRLDGEVLLCRPLQAHAIIGLLTSCMFGLAIWIGTGSYARTEITRGMLATDAETAKVIAPRPGVVTHLAVTDGQKVHKGMVLATIQVDQLDADGKRATEERLGAIDAQKSLGIRQIAAARAQGDSERVGLLAGIESNRAQSLNVKEQVSIQSSIIKSLEVVYERYLPLASRGFIAQSQMEARKQQILEAKQQLSQLKQKIILLDMSNNEAMAQLRRSEAAEEGQANSAKSSLEGLRAERSRLKAEQAYVLTAPVDGVVTTVQTGVGRTVDSIMPLMTIVPTNSVVHADLYAPSRAIGFLRVGDEVRLLYDAFPHQRFGSFRGSVRVVSRVALDPRQIDAPFKSDEPVYRVTVTLERQTVSGYGEDVRLQPGMTLSANIILERRNFLQWVLEPLDAVMKREI